MYGKKINFVIFNFLDKLDDSEHFLKKVFWHVLYGKKTNFKIFSFLDKLDDSEHFLKKNFFLEHPLKKNFFWEHPLKKIFFSLPILLLLWVTSVFDPKNYPLRHLLQDVSETPPPRTNPVISEPVQCRVNNLPSQLIKTEPETSSQEQSDKTHHHSLKTCCNRNFIQ